MAHTFQVISEIESLRADLKTAGTNVRSFVITNDDLFLPEFYRIRDMLLSKVKSIEQLTSDNPTQADQVKKLSALVVERVSESNTIVALQQTGAKEEIGTILKKFFLQPEGLSLEILFNSMIREEQRLLDLRTQSMDKSLGILNLILTFVLGLDIVFVIVIYYYFDRYLKERRESEQRFRAVFEQAAVGIEQIDPEGLIVSANPKLSQMLGYPGHELIGMPWVQLVHPDEIESAKTNDSRLFRGEITSYSMEKRYLRKDGAPVWIAVTSSAVDLGQGRPTYRLSIVEDITRRKLAEVEREKLLHDSQVAIRLKDEFLMTVTHELRTPLNVVLGHADLLKDEEPLSDDVKQSIEAIHRSALTQVRLVNDLLDVAAAATGKLTFNAEETDLRDILQEVIEMFRPAARAKRIKLEWHSPADKALIWGDVIRLRQIFWNLLSNAIKFTPKGGLVNVELMHGDRGFMVKVSDSGVGIDNDFLPYIFDAFRQEDGSTTRGHGGLGLGLSIAKQLAELHGGTLKASSPGKSYGSTFIAFFPDQLPGLPK